MDKRNNIKDAITSIKKRSLYNVLLWCTIFAFWSITDIISIALPDIYKAFSSLFRFGTTISLAGLYMLKTQYTDETSFIKKVLVLNAPLKNEITKKYFLRNTISIIIIMCAFLFRAIARIKAKIIYVFIGFLILLIAELVIYSFSKSIISIIEANLWP